MDAKKIDELEAIALEMQQIYYANERHMDECFYGERLGLDNVTGNLGTYELWWAINDGNATMADKVLKEIEDFFNEIKRLADNKGYGPRAAARGFDVTRPIGRYWTLACKGLRVCGEMRAN